MSHLPEYSLVRSRRRTMELRVLPGRQVEVRAPRSASSAAIREFVASQADWLQRTLERAALQPLPLDLHLVDGARLPFLGESLTLQTAPALRAASREGTVLLLPLDKGDRLRHETLLQHWYRQQAYQHFNAHIDRLFPWFAARGYQRPRLRVKVMRSRWGSLSSRGYINLNLMLICFPPQCLDYVVVHELCHLVHRNHGSGFRQLMDELLPDWQARKTLLNRLPTVSLLAPRQRASTQVPQIVHA